MIHSLFSRRCLALFACILFAFSAHAEGLKPQSFTTEKGIKGLALVESQLPMVTLKLLFPHAGGVSDPEGKAGRAFFAARMLTEGAGRYDAAELRERLETHAIRFDADTNEDYLVVTVQCLSEHLDEALRLTGLILSKPRFASPAISRVRQQVLTELAQLEKKPSWMAVVEWQKRAFGNHPYASAMQGNTESINAIRQQDLVSWQMQSLTKQNMQVSVVGDISLDAFQKTLDTAFDSMPEKLHRAHASDAPDIPTGGEPVLVQNDLPQSVVMFGVPALSRHDPDFYAAYLLNHILGGGSLTSRLSATLRQQHGLIYSVFTAIYPRMAASTLQGRFATRNETAAKAVQLMGDVLRNIAVNGVTEKELENARNYITGSFPLSLDDQKSRAHYLSIMLLYKLGEDYFQQRNGYFEAVTLEQVNRVAKELLSQRPLTVVAGNPPEAVNWE